jgi:transcriptional regulator with XRE-family HTH domain
VDAIKLRERLAKNVRAAAKKRGTSLNALADEIGMSRGTIHYIVTSQVATTVDTIARVAGGLGVDPAELLRK